MYEQRNASIYNKSKLSCLSNDASIPKLIETQPYCLDTNDLLEYRES